MHQFTKSTYHTRSHHGLSLRYSVIPLFFFYSSQSEHEVSLSLSALLPLRFSLVNLISDKCYRVIANCFHLCIENSNFSTLSGFYRVRPFTRSLCHCCNLSVSVTLNVQFNTNGMCAKNNTHIYVARTSSNKSDLVG